MYRVPAVLILLIRIKLAGCPEQRLDGYPGRCVKVSDGDKAFGFAIPLQQMSRIGQMDTVDEPQVNATGHDVDLAQVGADGTAAAGIIIADAFPLDQFSCIRSNSENLVAQFEDDLQQGRGIFGKETLHLRQA